VHAGRDRADVWSPIVIGVSRQLLMATPSRGLMTPGSCLLGSQANCQPTIGKTAGKIAARCVPIDPCLVRTLVTNQANSRA
jgi:hypothetical protein